MPSFLHRGRALVCLLILLCSSVLEALPLRAPRTGAILDADAKGYLVSLADGRAFVPASSGGLRPAAEGGEEAVVLDGPLRQALEELAALVEKEGTDPETKDDGTTSAWAGFLADARKLLEAPAPSPVDEPNPDKDTGTRVAPAASPEPIPSLVSPQPAASSAPGLPSASPQPASVALLPVLVPAPDPQAGPVLVVTGAGVRAILGAPGYVCAIEGGLMFRRLRGAGCEVMAGAPQARWQPATMEWLAAKLQAHGRGPLLDLRPRLLAVAGGTAAQAIRGCAAQLHLDAGILAHALAPQIRKPASAPVLPAAPSALRLPAPVPARPAPARPAPVKPPKVEPVLVVGTDSCLALGPEGYTAALPGRGRLSRVDGIAALEKGGLDAGESDGGTRRRARLARDLRDASALIRTFANPQRVPPCLAHLDEDLTLLAEKDLEPEGRQVHACLVALSKETYFLQTSSGRAVQGGKGWARVLRDGEGRFISGTPREKALEVLKPLKAEELVELQRLNGHLMFVAVGLGRDLRQPGFAPFRQVIQDFLAQTKDAGLLFRRGAFEWLAPMTADAATLRAAAVKGFDPEGGVCEVKVEGGSLHVREAMGLVQLSGEAPGLLFMGPEGFADLSSGWPVNTTASRFEAALDPGARKGLERLARAVADRLQGRGSSEAPALTDTAKEVLGRFLQAFPVEVPVEPPAARVEAVEPPAPEAVPADPEPAPKRILKRRAPEHWAADAQPLPKRPRAEKEVGGYCQACNVTWWHRKRHHEAETHLACVEAFAKLAEPERARTFAEGHCRWCGRDCSTSRGLTSHLRGCPALKGSQPFADAGAEALEDPHPTCTLCEMSFRSRRSYRTHLKSAVHLTAVRVRDRFAAPKATGGEAQESRPPAEPVLEPLPVEDLPLLRLDLDALAAQSTASAPSPEKPLQAPPPLPAPPEPGPWTQGSQPVQPGTPSPEKAWMDLFVLDPEVAKDLDFGDFLAP